MTQPILLTGQVYAVEVPEGAENIRVSQLIGTPKLFADIPGYLYAAKLPPGNWQLIGTTKEVTDQQLTEIFGITREALPDLLEVNNLDSTKNYVLLKRN